MNYLHALTDFVGDVTSIPTLAPNYYYQGYCPQTGELLQLPRTNLAEAIAKSLMFQLEQDQLYNREGKMYGILIVELDNGEQKVLKAFSGLLNSCSMVEGWVPPISGRTEMIGDETQTLNKLATIKQEIIELMHIPERAELEKLKQEIAQQLQAINLLHQQRKQQRHQQRDICKQTLTDSQLTSALADLETASRQDGIERKLLKRSHHQKILPLQQIIETADRKIQQLKQHRQQLSRQLQVQMHATYSLMNFFGQSQTLQQLLPKGLPTGTGDCCTPKLLNYAAKNRLKPLAIAEFWWGKATNDKIPGNFYGACQERCQPIMGFLLSGFNHLSDSISSCYGLDIIYVDKSLIIVNKPTELLSVPGRYLNTQDSVMSRLRNLYDDGEDLRAIHRLDLETSGILLIARNQDIHRQISQQFQNRLVSKVYEALLDGVIENRDDSKNPIELPLWGNPEHRPYQEVNWSLGKPSITYMQVIETMERYTRVLFRPITGRTHQLRVHAAHPQGLGIPILGDRLYGVNTNHHRLCLHAREIEFYHPKLGTRMFLKTKTPF